MSSQTAVMRLERDRCTEFANSPSSNCSRSSIRRAIHLRSSTTNKWRVSATHTCTTISSSLTHTSAHKTRSHLFLLMRAGPGMRLITKANQPPLVRRPHPVKEIPAVQKKRHPQTTMSFPPHHAQKWAASTTRILPSTSLPRLCPPPSALRLSAGTLRGR